MRPPCRDPLGRRGHGPGGAARRRGTPTFYIEWHTLGSAGSIMAHLVSLVVNGVFERLPGLRVLLLEGGLAWLPGILWRLDTQLARATRRHALADPQAERGRA